MPREETALEHPHPNDTSLAVVLKSLWLVVAISAGSVENALVIYTVVKDRKLHQAPYYFMVNLSMADLLRSVICFPVVLATVMHDSVWSYGDSACKLMAFFNTFLMFGSLFALFVSAIDRHTCVVHYRFHSRKFKGLMCLVVILIGWTVSFLLAFPPVFGLGTYGFIPFEAQCALEHRHYTQNDTLGFTMIFMAMALLIMFVYARIFVFLRDHRKMKPVLYEPARSDNWTFVFPANAPNALQMNNLLNPAGIARAVTNPQGIGAAGVPGAAVQPHVTGRYVCSQAKTERLTRVFVSVAVLFDVLWAPYVLMTLWYMLDPDRGVSYVFASMATWLTYSQTATLPLVYVLCHKPFRQSVSRSISISSNIYTYMLREGPVEA